MKPIYGLIMALLSLLYLDRGQLLGQPYIDICNARTVQSPNAGNAPKEKNATDLNYFNTSFTLPIFLKNKRDAVILSPFFERWSSTVSNVYTCSQYHYGIALPVSFLKYIPHSNWTILPTVIVRMNDAEISRSGKWQVGGAFIAAHYSDNKKLTWKVGLYVNGEFFGLFLMPLVGIDWQINDKTNLFGVLPAGMTLERRLNSHFCTGATFRTFTNSYHDSAQTYFRVDENQFGLFVDYYITRHFVVNAEAGHSILRKLRSGIKHEATYNWNASDNPYFKFSIAYRIRTR